MADTLVNKNQLGEGVYTDDSLIFNRNLELDDVYSNDVILLANLNDNDHVSFPNVSLVQNTGTIDETYTHFDVNSYQLNAYNTSTYGSGQKYLTYNLGNKLNDIDFTIDLWFYNRNVNQSTYNVIFELKNSTSSKSFMKVMGNYGIYMNGIYSSASSTTSLNTWHHIGLTYKVASGEMKMFVDGTLKTQSTVESNAPNLLFGEIYLSSYCTSYSVCAIQGLRVRKGIHSNNDESFTVPTAFGTTVLTDKKSLNVAIDTLLNKKQDTLVSGSNIKTINNNSIVGSGNVDTLPSQSGQSGKFLTTDGTNASWANLSTDNVYTKTNLLAGENIQFRTYTDTDLDEHTMLLLHFNDSLDDSSLYSSTSTKTKDDGTEWQISSATYDDGKFGKCIKSLYTDNSNIPPQWRNYVFSSITSAFTIDFWFYTNSSSNAHICVKNASNIVTQLLELWYYQGWRASFCGSSVSATLTSNNWHHIAITVTHNGAANLFIDGVLTTTRSSYNYNLSSGLNAVLLWTQGTQAGGQIYTDEFRLSDIIRYTENFDVPTVPYGSPIGEEKTAVDCTIDISGKQDLLTPGVGIDITEESDETVISSIGVVNQNNPLTMIKLWKGSQVEYDALVSGGTVDANTFYIITEESN